MPRQTCVSHRLNIISCMNLSVSEGATTGGFCMRSERTVLSKAVAQLPVACGQGCRCSGAAPPEMAA